MKALILAAGAGTRLRPLTEDTAKPALPVCGVPTLWYGAWWLKKNLEISEFGINCSYKYETVLEATQDKELVAFTGINFFISNEGDKILGSSGALEKVKNWVNKELLAVINADAIQAPNWPRLLKCHQKSKGLLTLHLRKFSNSSELYTTVEIDAHGRILGFGKKSNSGIMFTGAYIIESKAIDMLPSGVSELMVTLLKPLIQTRELFGFVEDECNWLDTGTPQSYAEANFTILKTHPEFRELIKVKSDIHSSDTIVVPKGQLAHARVSITAPFVLNASSENWLKCIKSQSCKLGPKLLVLPGAEVPSKPESLVSKILNKNSVIQID